MSINTISSKFFSSLQQQLKVISTNRKVLSADGNSLGPIGEVHLWFQIGNIVFYNRSIILDNLQCDIILGLPWQHNYRIGCNWNQEGKHFITIKNQFLALSIAPHVLRQLAKTKGQCTLQCRSIMWISVQKPQNLNTNSLFEINLDRQLPKGTIPLDMLHNINHKQPCKLVVPLLNMAHTDVKLLKNTVLGSSSRVNNVDSVHEVSWENVQTTKDKEPGTTSQDSQTQKLLPAFPEQSSFQIHANNDSKLVIKLKDADIPQIVKNQLNQMLNTEFTCIVSKSSTDFGRTNLVEFDVDFSFC